MHTWKNQIFSDSQFVLLFMGKNCSIIFPEPHLFISHVFIIHLNVLFLVKKINKNNLRFVGSTSGQSQLVCSGCRNLLMYPVGATSVCCAVCNAVTAVPPPGTEMAQLVCGGCHTLLMYIRGATSVQCSCCHTVNLALEGLHAYWSLYITY
jgi:LSD1 subclass zinc finger protein